jgi:electron transport complex protein RnfG
MKKLESSLKNMLLVLTGITAISVALLAWVNELTKEPIAEANAKTLNEALGQVLPEFDNNPSEACDTINNDKGTFVVYRATKDGQPVGAAVQSSSLGFGGDLVVLVGFNNEGVIQGYSILATSETPGLGSKAAEWFRTGEHNIIGMNPGEGKLVVKKDDSNSKIDAITASTITSRAFLKAVNAAYDEYVNASKKSTASEAAPEVQQTEEEEAVAATDSTNVE